jgi:hypothetical protein
MTLFRRNKASSNSTDANPESKKEKGSWRRPASTSAIFSASLCACTHPFLDTAFKQQRLKAWQPILTPKTVLPTLFIIGIIFAPIGALLIWGNGLVCSSLLLPFHIYLSPSQVTEMSFDYTNCDSLTPSQSLTSLTLSNLPTYSYQLRSSDSKAEFDPPQYAFISNASNPDVFSQNQCVINFDIPADLKPSVFLYFKLTNFYQNHRRYVKSFDSSQLKGSFRSVSDLKNGDCKPVAVVNNEQVVYPCGLIANSMFNGSSGQL